MTRPRSMHKAIAFAVPLVLLGCGETEPSSLKDGAATAASAAAPPSASVPPRATSSSAAPLASSASPTQEQVCRLEKQSAVATGVNPRTGLTAVRLAGGKTAVGYAVGHTPYRLELAPDGTTVVSKLALAEAHPLHTNVERSQGVRHLQRVTVTSGGAAFADYRDKYKSGRRRIACGPLRAETPYLVFDGRPLLDVDTSGRRRPRARPPGPSTPSASAAPSATTAPSSSASPRRKKWPPGPLRELRDCRTFSDAAGNDVWALGSELRGERRVGDAVSWSMNFVARGGFGKAEPVLLGSVPIGENPDKLYTLEAPVAHRVGDKWALVGRYRGELYGWLLEGEKKKRGERRIYRGGYPSMPRFAVVGTAPELLFSQLKRPQKWSLAAIPLPEMPAQPLRPRIEAQSASEPGLVSVGGQLWLGYQVGPRRRGPIELVPVDAQLRQVGRAFSLAMPDEREVFEAVIAPAGDDIAVVGVLRATEEKPAEVLVSTLRCEKKPLPR